ncbi:MAG: response regulator [Acidobacteriota bacterium]
MPKTLLLVEDHPIVAALEQRQLARLGYQVIHAPSGERAVAEVRAKAGRIDLILMDIDLGPGMDGVEAARIITDEYDIPVIFLSSHAEREVVERTAQVPCCGYVLKSSGVAGLDAAIRAAFAHRDDNAAFGADDDALPGSDASSPLDR